MKFKKTLSAVLASFLTLTALSLPASARDVSICNDIRTYDASTVPAPLVGVDSGTYVTAQGLSVFLVPMRSSDQIWYSLNNTAFRRFSGTYLSITQNSVLNVYSVRDGQRSSVKTYTYKLVPDVTVSLKGGVYNGAQRVFVNSPVKDAKLFYTTDGSIPNERSAQYSPSTGILIKKSGNLKVAAIKSGWNTKILSNTYVIIGGQNTADDPLDDGGLIKPADTSTSMSKSKLDDFKSKWYYNQLTATQKTVYERIFNASKEHAVNISIADLKINANDFGKAYWACDYDNPQHLANGSGYSYSYSARTGLLSSFTIQYGRSESQIKAIEPIFKSTVDGVVKEAEKKIGDYEKVKYIHDWIINRTKYTSTGGAYIREADGVVVYGRALCEGYSKTFMYIAQQLGFDCICVAGKGNGGSHMWNMIKVGGQWYHVDVTFDDPIMSDGSDALFHNYFLISTSEISKTHTLDNDLKVPTAARSY